MFKNDLNERIQEAYDGGVVVGWIIIADVVTSEGRSLELTIAADTPSWTSWGMLDGAMRQMDEIVDELQWSAEDREEGETDV